MDFILKDFKSSDPVYTVVVTTGTTNAATELFIKSQKGQEAIKLRKCDIDTHICGNWLL